MLKTELKLPFVWYSALNKQHRFRTNNIIKEPYALISPDSSLLPFEIKRPYVDDAITEWKVYDLNDTPVADLLTDVIGLETADTVLKADLGLWIPSRDIAIGNARKIYFPSNSSPPTFNSRYITGINNGDLEIHFGTDSAYLRMAASNALIAKYTSFVEETSSKTSLETTIDVSRSNTVTVNDASSTTVTSITGGINGQVIILRFANGNTTIQNNSTIALNGGVNYVSSANSPLGLQWNGSKWIQLFPSTTGGSVYFAETDPLSIYNQYASKQTAKAWIDTLRAGYVQADSSLILKKLSTGASTDSLLVTSSGVTKRILQPGYLQYSSVATNQTTTSATAADVTGLSIPVLANTTYRIQCALWIGCDNTGGVNFAINAPSGSSILSGNWMGSSTSNTAVIISRVAAIGVLNTTAFERVSGVLGGVNATVYVSIGSTAGNLTIQFASGVATQTSTVYAGSTMDAVPILHLL